MMKDMVMKMSYHILIRLYRIDVGTDFEKGGGNRLTAFWNSLALAFLRFSLAVQAVRSEIFLTLRCFLSQATFEIFLAG